MLKPVAGEDLFLSARDDDDDDDDDDGECLASCRRHNTTREHPFLSLCLSFGVVVGYPRGFA